MPDKKVIVEYVGDIEKEQKIEIAALSAANTEDDRTRRIFTQRRQWPNACLRCGGDGGISGFGGGLTEDDIDETLCPSCLSQGKCPRCASALPDDWREKVNGLYLAIQNGSQPPPPAKCAVCRWEDGDPPVMELQGG
jgi:hypothetical protein